MVLFSEQNYPTRSTVFEQCPFTSHTMLLFIDVAVLANPPDSPEKPIFQCPPSSQLIWQQNHSLNSLQCRKALWTLWNYWLTEFLLVEEWWPYWPTHKFHFISEYFVMLNSSILQTLYAYNSLCSYKVCRECMVPQCKCNVDCGFVWIMPLNVFLICKNKANDVKMFLAFNLYLFTFLFKASRDDKTAWMTDIFSTNV